MLTLGSGRGLAGGGGPGLAGHLLGVSVEVVEPLGPRSPQRAAGTARWWPASSQRPREGHEALRLASPRSACTSSTSRPSARSSAPLREPGLRSRAWWSWPPPRRRAGLLAWLPARPAPAAAPSRVERVFHEYCRRHGPMAGARGQRRLPGQPGNLTDRARMAGQTTSTCSTSSSRRLPDRGPACRVRIPLSDEEIAAGGLPARDQRVR